MKAALFEPAYLAALEPMTLAEQELLKRAEEIISNNYTSFMAAASALRDICRQRLYRETDNTWQGYCQRRWGISGRHGYRQIEAADTLDRIGAAVGDVNEATARVLGSFEEEIQKAVFQVALATATRGTDGRPIITAAHIKAVGDQLTGWVVSGGMDNGNGEMKPLGVLVKAHITEDVYERLMRQSGYIREKMEAKNGNGAQNGHQKAPEPPVGQITEKPATAPARGQEQANGNSPRPEMLSTFDNPPTEWVKEPLIVPEIACSAGMPERWTQALELYVSLRKELQMIIDIRERQRYATFPTYMVIKMVMAENPQAGLIVGDTPMIANCAGCEAQQVETSNSYMTFVENKSICSASWSLCERCISLYLEVVKCIKGTVRDER